MVFGITLGMLCLCIYLILVGLSALVPGMGKLGKVIPVFALAAGVLILVGR